MDRMEMSQAVESVEAIEDGVGARRALDDATYDSGSYVEQLWTFEEAEVIEAVLVALADNTLEETGLATEGISKGGALVKEVDPDTGQMIPSGGGGGSGGSSGGSGSDQSGTTEGATSAARTEGAAGQDSDTSSETESSDLPGQERVVTVEDLQGDMLTKGAKSLAGDGDPQALAGEAVVGSGRIIPEGLEQKAKAMKGIVGVGTQGAFGKGVDKVGGKSPVRMYGSAKGGSGHSTKVPGSGSSGKSGGSSTSESGFPGSGPGAGWVGAGGKKGGKSGGKSSGSKGSSGGGSGSKGGSSCTTGAAGFVMRLKDALQMEGWTCEKNAKGKTWCTDPKDKSHKMHSAVWDRCYTLDGVQPMPYTGKIWYEKPEPSDAPIGGMDHEEEIESGHFVVVVTRSGKGGGGGIAGPDDDLDDSGHWYGGIMGGGDGIFGPDDLDYHEV